MSTILVTGATGFVGGHLAKALAEAGTRLRVLARSPEAARGLAGLDVDVVRGDLTEAASLRGICDGVDTVFHTACAVAETFDAHRDAEILFDRVNVGGTRALAEEALRAGARRFVHVSSTAAMGTPRASVVDETTECRPVTPYAISKRQAELALLALHRERGLPAVIVRPCLVAGPGKRHGELVKLFRLARHGLVPVPGGRLDVHKPLLHVADLVAALRAAAERGRPGGIYLVHDDGDHTLGDILAAVGRLVGRRRVHVPVPLLAARAAAIAFEAVRMVWPGFNPPLTRERLELLVQDRRIDISRARQELGFAPRHQDLDELLGETYRWHANHGDL